MSRAVMVGDVFITAVKKQQISRFGGYSHDPIIVIICNPFFVQ